MSNTDIVLLISKLIFSCHCCYVLPWNDNFYLLRPDLAVLGLAWRKQGKNWHKSCRVKNGKETAGKKLKIFGCCATTPGTEAQHSGQAGSFLPVGALQSPAVLQSRLLQSAAVQSAGCAVGPRHLGSVLRTFLFPAETGIALLILQHFTTFYMAFKSEIRQRGRETAAPQLSPPSPPILVWWSTSLFLLHHIVLDQSDSKTLPTHFSSHQLQFELL